MRACDVGPSIPGYAGACHFDASLRTEIGSSYDELASRIESHLPISAGAWGTYKTSFRSSNRVVLWLWGYDIYGGYGIRGFSNVDFGSNCVCNRTLQLSAGGEVDVNEVLPNQNITVLGCGGQPEAGVAVEVQATPVDPPNGQGGRLRAAGSSSAGSTVISGTTNASGDIKLEFLAPAVAGTHALTARCTDPIKPCAPAGPATVTVKRRAYTLDLQVNGAAVREGETLEGHRVEVRLDGQPAPFVPVEIRAAPQLLVYPAADLYPAFLEQASCSSGPVMQCTTDADGVIEFLFAAPTLEAGEQVLYDISARCVDAGKPCTPDPAGPQTVTVEQCPIELNLALDGQNVVEPSGELSWFTVAAENCRGEPAAGLSVVLANTWQQGTGGHNHGPHDDPLRLGGFASVDSTDGWAAASCEPVIDAESGLPVPGQLQCATDGDGRIHFTFKAPAPAGTHDISARCAGDNHSCNEPAPISVDVKVEGLEPLTFPSTGYFRFIGQTDKHDETYFLTAEATRNLARLGQGYFERYGEQLYLNDASLPWGGLFDIGGAWAMPHHEHRCGRAIDVRGNGNRAEGAVPERRDEKFQEIARDSGVDVYSEYDEFEIGTGRQVGFDHYHLWLLGTARTEDGRLCKDLQ